MGGGAESWQWEEAGWGGEGVGGSEVFRRTKFVIWEPDESRKRGPVFWAQVSLVPFSQLPVRVLPLGSKTLVLFDPGTS